MEVKQFIEKAIEGGYKGRGIATDGSWFGDSVFLIPEVWQAVGKVSGWKESVERVSSVCKYDGCFSDDQSPEEFEEEMPEIMKELRKDIKCEDDTNEYRLYKTVPEWKSKMHRLIDALAEGKTITQFIETL